jgi:hypothetical protein
MIYYRNDLLIIGFQVIIRHLFKDFIYGFFFLIATPHRGSAYRCLQTKYWKDTVLRSIAERSCLPLHRYLPAIFTVWIGKLFRFELFFIRKYSPKLE